MTIRHLEALLRPASIAVFGASADETGTGGQVLRHLQQGGFAGPILPVSSATAGSATIGSATAIGGILAYPDVASLPLAPDLAVICDPDPAHLPALIAALGQRGTRAAALIGAGWDRSTETGAALAASLQAARPHLLRLLGPGSQGLLSPESGLNASLSPTLAGKGRIGFVSRQGALWSAVLDWATSRGLGFSHAISLGLSADIDLGDTIDYLASDPETRAIVLCFDHVSDGRKFMSAARAAARNKPVVAVRIVNPGIGSPGADEVYSAAFRRAGIVRVDGIEELFDAVETLSRARRLPGERLAILSGGEGPEALALDALRPGSGRLARLGSATLSALARLGGESVANPLILPERAEPARLGQALGLLLADEGVDAALVLAVPSALTPGQAAAEAVIEAAGQARKNVLTCWLGRDAAAPARQLFAAAGLPSYETPRAALRAFLHMVEYRHTQDMLMETPPEVPADFVPDPATAKAVIVKALAEGRHELPEPAAGVVLAAYGIPVVETVYVPNIEAAQAAAARLGYPVALKILSPDIPSRHAVGGVVPDLEKRRQLRRAAEAMQTRIARLAPAARIEGFAVQAQDRRPQALALGLGVFLDPLFGPALRFGASVTGRGGASGVAEEDQALGLPPLNLSLAADLIGRTRIGRHLQQRAASGGDAGLADPRLPDPALLALILVKLSQLVVDLPEIVAIEIDPLHADASGAAARGARIRIAAAAHGARDRLAIRPYPQHLEESIALRDGSSVLLRPIRPEDEPAHLEFFNRLDPQDVRFRFFNMVRILPHSEMARYTQIDYDRQMAFIATRAGNDGKPETLGVVRTIADPDNESAEFAIVVRSDLKGTGLGRALMEKIIRYCRGRGTGRIFGLVLRENYAMRKFSESLGFHPHRIAGEDALEMTLDLREGGGSAPASKG